MYRVVQAGCQIFRFQPSIHRTPLTSRAEPLSSSHSCIPSKMTRPLTQSDLIFPTQSLNFSATLQSLKRSALSITNRLASITADSSFVTSVAEAYDLPLVANERCGSWYIPPEKKGGGVYFKSTDGHMNEWSFNLRRLNLHLLDLVGGNAGG